jgi:fatty-acyl-CoA synthase
MSAKSMNVAWWVERWATLYPNKPALIFEDKRLTYSGLHRSACRTAGWLDDHGVGKGDRVVVFLDNCLEFMEVYIACARTGAIFVPINFRLAPPELEYILRNSRPSLLVFSAPFVETVRAVGLDRFRPPLLAAQVGTGEGLEGALDYAEETKSYDGESPYVTGALGVSDPEEPQVIMYTSGTTGHPKGAVLTYRKTFFNCLNADIFFNLSHDDVMLVVLPLFHSGGLFVQTSPVLYKGASVVLLRRFDPERTLQAVEQHRVTKFLGVPTMFRELTRLDPAAHPDLSSLEVSTIGGERVTPELIEKCNSSGFKVRQLFGQTETSILLWASEEESLIRHGTAGRPVFHAEVEVVDASGVPVPRGQVGEIAVRGSILMKEYWRDPEETQRTIRGDWLYTGDLAKQDEEGYFYLVDRARDMYVSGGENVYPAEIERVLRTHEAIEDVAVVGVPDEKWGEVGHCFVIPNPGKELTEQDVLDHCRQRLAGYKVPKRVIFRRDFPRTPLGKCRKFLLRKELLEGEGTLR